ncbi:hypothetical protein B4U80_11520 [Leptotrombidium deliense]|uniref:Uncharacterized protein n=1 Tax=Leptotrombidium deliense TaxID=299467 RepID=A0A443SLY1_9ACAR|nr:hypothetical protein B4U80_11520 [Leptotrombidium deliense]
MSSDVLSSSLVHLTRLHSLRTLSEGSIFSNSEQSLSIQANYGHNDDQCSLKHLRQAFFDEDTEKLFIKYKTRVQHNFFMVSLLLNIGFNSLAMIVFFLDKIITFVT